MQLKNKTSLVTIFEKVERASTMGERMLGLLGRTSLPTQSCLWIEPCNNIHTFFMKFNLDLIFVDKHLKVLKVLENVKPFQLRFAFKAQSVFEASSQNISSKVSIGDQLYVVD